MLPVFLKNPGPDSNNKPFALPVMKKKKRLLLVITLVAIVLLLLFSFLIPRPANHLPAIASDPAANTRTSDVSLQELRERQAKARVHSASPTDEFPYPILKPEPMKLEKKELVRKEWNSGPDAFSNLPSKQSGAIGPNAVVYSKDKIYVLDNVGSRIMTYDLEGKLLSSIPLPTSTGQDLFPNPSGDGSLILVDRMGNKIYRINGSEVSLIGTADLRTSTAYGIKFDMDPKTGELLVQDSEDPQDQGRDIKDGKALVRLKNGQWVALEFDKPVVSVEEVVTDGQGNTWVFYQLDGDYRQGRIARIDPAGHVAGMAEIDTFYTFDTTRRLVATDNGVLVLGGDDKEGNLRSFNYAGSAIR